ncbi:LamG domain-containing protein [Candidatus Curtissbacteria bacterium]|nr:LamG domain-containing protein [Candidatus Curtissbacteria bacterium]
MFEGIRAALGSRIKLVLRSIAVFILLAGLGVGVYLAQHWQEIRTKASTSGTPTEVYFSQPSISSAQVEDTIIGEIQPQNNKFLIRMASMGQQSDNTPLTWNVGQYTGFTPDTCPPYYQRGPNNTGGTTAVQVKDATGGIWINSTSIAHSGTLIPITPGYWWDAASRPRPWTTAGIELSYAFELKVPTATRKNDGEVYIIPYFFFRDTVSGKAFWYGAQTFDLRPAFAETVLFDSATNSPIALSSINTGTAWTHLGPNSSTFQQAPWSDFKYFEFRINVDDFQKALAAVRIMDPKICSFCSSFSTDPTNYLLEHFNLNPEVYDAPTGSSGQLGLAFRNIVLASYQLPTPAPTTASGGYSFTNTSLNNQVLVYWNMDETSGTTVDDSVSTNNGTATGTTIVGPPPASKIGYARSFAGATTSYVNIPSNFGLTNTNTSIAAWVYLSSASLKGAFVKVGGNNMSGYAIGVGSSSFDDSGNNLIILFENVRWINTGRAIGTGWHHVAMTIDSSGTPTGYLDGVAVGSFGGGAAINPTSSTQVGGYTVVGVNRYVNAIIDEAGIWNRPLTLSEVASLAGGDYYKGSVGPTPSTTIMYDKIYIRGANATSNANMQVYFKTSTSNFYSEDKSVWVNFPTGGGWWEVVADMSGNPQWKGTITGVRVDPFNTTGYFGIDYVYVGNASRNYIQRWEFNGSPARPITSPFFGWSLSNMNMADTWTDGNLWGGLGTTDPYFSIDTNFASGK